MVDSRLEPAHHLEPTHRSPPRCEGTSSIEEAFPESHSPSINTSENFQIYLDAPSEPPCSSEPSSSRNTYIHQYRDAANDFTDYRIPNFGIDTNGSFARDPQPSTSPLAFDNRNDCALLRGVENWSEEARNSFQDLGVGHGHSQVLIEPDCQYNTHSSSIFPAHSETPTPMSSRYQATRNTKGGVGTSTTYAPFQGEFVDSDAARNYRKDALRFERKPYRPPEADPTIWDLERYREYWVKRIYDAMIQGENAKDNPKSNAMRRWTETPFYDSLLVEAHAHKIFDALLVQVKEGFRGWKHDDYTQDERKGEAEDQEVSCKERLLNVIKALEEEKTICEDVMNSSCQIRMFVNAPKAYAARKLNNRVGNSKRKRATKDTVESTANDEENPRPAKTRRQPPRKSRQRALHISQPTPSERPLRPQYSPAPQQLASNPTSSYLAHGDRYTPTELITSFGQGHQVDAMSPSQPHASHIPRVTSMSPSHQSLFMSPPSLSMSHYSASAPVTPEQLVPVNDFERSWQHAGTHGQAPLDPALLFSNSNVADPQLFNSAWSWPELNSSCSKSGDHQFRQTSNDQFPLFSPSMESSADPGEDDTFQKIWSNIPDVQPYPDNGTSGMDQDMKNQQ